MTTNRIPSWITPLSINSPLCNNIEKNTSLPQLPPRSRGVNRYTVGLMLFDLKGLVLQRFDLNDFVLSEMKRHWKNNSLLNNPPEMAAFKKKKINSPGGLTVKSQNFARYSFSYFRPLEKSTKFSTVWTFLFVEALNFNVILFLSPSNSVKSTKISSCEPVSSQKYENGYRTKFVTLQ